jgi:formate hydrogenlyase subunit 4
VSTASRVSTYAYVNPVIAVLLGWLVLGETISGRMLWGALVVLAGVITITVPQTVISEVMNRLRFDRRRSGAAPFVACPDQE